MCQPRMVGRMVLVLLVSGSICLAQEPAPRKKKNENRRAESQAAARTYPPQMFGAVDEVYKTVGDVPLRIYRYLPPGHQPTDRRPAIVFFFGGGWKSGTPQQFHHHCQHLARRGMVALAADYRVSSRHQTQAVDSVRDAKSAIRWVRQHAERLGIDPERIAAGGGSAGGHLAACCGLIPGLDEPGENRAIRSVPNALVLFNPAVILAPVADRPELTRRGVSELAERLGVPPVQLSPFHHIAADAPPTIVFHGRADSTVPVNTVEAFAEAMRKAGNRCELALYPGQEHGFFNYGRNHNEFYERTVQEMDAFLQSIGYLAEPAAAR